MSREPASKTSRRSQKPPPNPSIWAVATMRTSEANGQQTVPSGMQPENWRPPTEGSGRQQLSPLGAHASPCCPQQV